MSNVDQPALPSADTSFVQAMMYMVCDGHGGSKAAKFAAANMHRYLVSKLPQQLPDFSVQQGAGRSSAAAQHDTMHAPSMHDADVMHD